MDKKERTSDMQHKLLQQSIQCALDRHQLETVLHQQQEELGVSEEKFRQLEVLYELSRQLGYTLNYEELVRLMLSHLYQAMPHDVSASILLTDECHLFIQPICPLTTKIQGEIQQRLQKTLNRIRGDKVFHSKKLCDVSSLKSEFFDATRSPIENLGSSFQVPIINAETQEVIGLLFIGAQAEAAFSEDQVKLLYTLANQASISIQRLRNLLAAEQQHLESLVENLPEGVLLLDEEYRIMIANRSAWRYLALLLNEVSGKTVTHLGSYSIESLMQPPPQGKFCHEILLEDWVFEVVAQRLAPPNAKWLLTIRDVTERKRAEESLRIHDRAIAASSNGIIIADARQKNLPIVYVNPAFEKITGYKKVDILNHTYRILLGKERHQPGLRSLRIALKEGQPCSVVINSYRKDGTNFWNELNVSPIYNAESTLTHFVGILTDITERKLAEEQLRYNAFYDALTGLPNRLMLMDRLQEAIARTHTHSDYVFAVLFLDLDRFKNINDSLGHTIGDEMLVAIARRIEKSLRTQDTIARLGGDEFAILLEDLEDLSEAVTIANRIHQALSSPVNLHRHEVFTTASVGIALSSTGYSHPEEVLRDADIAMYQAKSLGKARNEVFDKAMHSHAVALLQLENDIRRAIEREEFQLYYQPIVSLDTQKITGFEALVRWQHPQKGLVSPAEFIPVAEETGLIILMSWWILREACFQLSRWQAEFPQSPPLSMSVNLSGRQFSQGDLVESVANILQQAHLAPGSLRLEITESAIMDNLQSASEMLVQLKALGVQLYMDDFGTGYSSLNYLRRFPFDTLKIDRSFVMQMSEDEESLEIVRTVIMLARNLKMKAIAEGVETQTQLKQLQALGCDYGQGYFFSKPVNAEMAHSLLTESI